MTIYHLSFNGFAQFHSLEQARHVAQMVENLLKTESINNNVGMVLENITDHQKLSVKASTYDRSLCVYGMQTVTAEVNKLVKYVNTFVDSPVSSEIFADNVTEIIDGHVSINMEALRAYCEKIVPADVFESFMQNLPIGS